MCTYNYIIPFHAIHMCNCSKEFKHVKWVKIFYHSLNSVVNYPIHASFCWRRIPTDIPFIYKILSFLNSSLWVYEFPDARMINLHFALNPSVRSFSVIVCPIRFIYSTLVNGPYTGWEARWSSWPNWFVGVLKPAKYGGNFCSKVQSQ